jgi:hypothetical protein
MPRPRKKQSAANKEKERETYKKTVRDAYSAGAEAADFVFDVWKLFR